MITELVNPTICVVGAGTVGLSLAEAFAKEFRVISYDIDDSKVKSLSEKNSNLNHSFTSDPTQISKADFICICVTTSISKSKEPDMSSIAKASVTVGRNLQKGATIILESSVYPGVTEEIVKPILEKESGLEYFTDFKLAYSPERINPGDLQHSIEKVTKIVAANEKETLTLVANLYRRVTPLIFEAKDIKTAEAAKLVENIQRDLNIALVNEFSMIFDKMGLSTKDVLDAAATKWNFHAYSPGIVGGECIPVVPYFLVHKALENGFYPQVILSARAINESIPKHVTKMTVNALSRAGKIIKGSRVLIMGCTYKENIQGPLSTPARIIGEELLDHGIDVWGYDPLIQNSQTNSSVKFVQCLSESPTMDCIILVLGHAIFRTITLDTLKNIMNSPPIMIDLRGFYESPEINDSFMIYKRL